ncbi:hypothetical protein D3C86_1135230 [compost metagenome]
MRLPLDFLAEPKFKLELPHVNERKPVTIKLLGVDPITVCFNVLDQGNQYPTGTRNPSFRHSNIQDPLRSRKAPTIPLKSTCPKVVNRGLNQRAQGPDWPLGTRLIYRSFPDPGSEGRLKRGDGFWRALDNVLFPLTLWQGRQGRTLGLNPSLFPSPVAPAGQRDLHAAANLGERDVRDPVLLGQMDHGFAPNLFIEGLA